MNKDEASSLSATTRIIRFDGPEPRIAFVCSTVFYSSFSSVGKGSLNITCYEQEAAEGRGSWISLTHLQVFDEELWKACLRWIDDRSKLADRYNKLRQGKFDKVLMVPMFALD